MNIKMRILLPTIALTFLVSGAILFSDIVLFSNFVTKAAAERVDAASKVAVHHLDDLKTKAAAASLSIAGNMAVSDALSAENRGELILSVTQILEETESDFCTVTDSDGTVLLRTHEPESFGDSIKERATVKAALSGESISAVEEGSLIKLSVCSASPVFDDSGAIIGTVSAGYRMDTNAYVDLTKEISGCEATVSVNGERLSTTVLNDDGTRAIGTKSDSEVFEIVSAGNVYTGRSTILGRAAVSSYVPLTNAGGRVIGMLFTGQYMDEMAETTRNFIQTGLLIALILLAAFAAVILFIAGHIEKRQNKMISDIKHRDHLLELALADAREANNAKSEFLAHMSHEMRTPLNAIIGLSEITLDDRSLGIESKSNLEKIFTSGATLLSIVNDVLDISKIQAGKFVIVPNQYDVPSLINDSVLQNALRIGSRPIRFILNADENLPAVLYGDELRVRQIINNLLSNAIKYTEEGEVEINLQSSRDGDSVWLAISVRDTGEGIRPAHMEYLFENYAQFGETSKRREGGTGLGLSITKSLAELMGGCVTVESEYGKGSLFTVRIRQGYVNGAVIGSAVAQSLKSFQYSTSSLNRSSRLNRIQLPYARVLVVDDNITNLDVARGLMKPYGMRIDCVTGGAEAVRVIRGEKFHYDAIFMDHMMPEMDGVEAVRIIREEIGTDYAKTIPVIALTANAISGSEEMFISNGFQGFISKPIDLSRLDEMIRRFVRDKEKEVNIMEDITQTEAPKPSASRLIEFARDIEGLDISMGLKSYGDENSLMQILRSYAVNTKVSLNLIRNVSMNTLRSYTVTVHGLKGASRNIFAENAGALAEALERAARADDLDFIAENNPHFIETVEKLIAGIEDMLDKALLGRPKLKRENLDREDLRRLYEACENYDFNTIDEIAEKIEAYDYIHDSELAGWLKNNIIQMNLSGIKERIGGLTWKMN